jgi:hypothetical protein
MSSGWDNDGGIFKVGRTRPLSVDEKRQRLIEAEQADLDLEEEFETLEKEISKGTPLDDAIEQALALVWDEISDETDGAREQAGESLRNLYRVVCELRALDENAVEERYRAHCRVAKDRQQSLEVEKDKSEFFSLPKAQAEFSYWKRKKYWHPKEAVALSFGKEPKAVNPKKLENLKRPNSPFVRKFQARMDALRRAIKANHLTTPLTPEKFVAWAVNEGFSLPSELNATQRADPSKEVAEKGELNPKKSDVFYRFLIGMAIQHYDLDPNYDPQQGGESKAFARMHHDLDQVGVRVDVKTLREHTKRALEDARAKGLRLKKPPAKRPSR